MFEDMDKENYLVLSTMIIFALLIIVLPGYLMIKYNKQHSSVCNELGYYRYENFLCVGKINEEGTIDLNKAIKYPAK